MSFETLFKFEASSERSLQHAHLAPSVLCFEVGTPVTKELGLKCGRSIRIVAMGQIGDQKAPCRTRAKRLFQLNAAEESWGILKHSVELGERDHVLGPR